MIARRITRKNKETPEDPEAFQRLANYIAAENEQGKCTELWAVNCVGSPEDLPIDLEMAIHEVMFIQRHYTGRGKDKVYHLLLSFPEDERPSIKDLDAIERRYAKAIGFEEHQRLVAVHDDTTNLHVHMAINKVHPKTGKLHTPFYDFQMLEKCRHEVEKVYGLTPTDGIRQGVPLSSTGAQDMEAHTHEKSFERQVLERRTEILTTCNEADTWQQLHKALDQLDLRIKPRTRGLVIGDGEKLWMKASSIDRSLSLGALEKRLGAFVAREGVKQKTQRPEAIWQKRKPVKKYRGRKYHALKRLWMGHTTWKTLLEQRQYRDPTIKAMLKANRKTTGWLRWIGRIVAASGKPRQRLYLAVPDDDVQEAKAVGVRWDREQKTWYLPQGGVEKKVKRWQAKDAAMEKVDLIVPYGETKEAKKAGARWDHQQKRWFLPVGGDREKAAKWIPQKVAEENVPLNIPYEEIGKAKAAGARWNKDVKSWYLPRGGDETKVSEWIPQETVDDSMKKARTNGASGRIVLDVLYQERKKAKAAGARWNKDDKNWYLPAGGDRAKVSEWIPQRDLSVVSSVPEDKENLGR